MHAGVKLALKRPLELRMVEVARVQIEIVGVNRHGRIFEIDDDFHRFAFCARVEVQQRVLIKPQLLQNTVEARVG